MKTGVVIVNYNDFLNTYNFINSIIDYKTIDKIVIVDNKSTDDSFDKLKIIDNKKIVLLQNTSNKGYASGINLGSKYLIDEYKKCNIIISNTDVIDITEEKFKTLINDLNSNDDIGIVAPIIKEYTGLNRGWIIPTPKQDILLNLPVIHRFLRKKMLFYKESFYDKKIVTVEAVSGCCFLIKSDVLKKINFMDENTFLYYEENILGKKLKNHNYKEIIDTDVTFFHNHSVTIDKSINRIKKFKILKSSQLYFQKNYNNASFCDIILLKLTNKIMIMILYVVVFFKGGFKK